MVPLRSCKQLRTDGFTEYLLARGRPIPKAAQNPIEVPTLLLLFTSLTVTFLVG